MVLGDEGLKLISLNLGNDKTLKNSNSHIYLAIEEKINPGFLSQ